MLSCFVVAIIGLLFIWCCWFSSLIVVLLLIKFWCDSLCPFWRCLFTYDLVDCARCTLLFSSSLALKCLSERLSDNACEILFSFSAN